MGLAPVFDFLLPERCLLCRGRSTGGLCRGCDADLPALGEVCSRCGTPLVFPWSGSMDSHCDLPYCGACIVKPPPYERTVAALDYVFPVTVLVQRFKFNRSLACGAVLAGRLLRALQESPTGGAQSAEVIVPVPLHPARQFLRVFNQAEVLARDLGKSLGIPVSPRALRRTRRTPAQSGLSAHDRRRNIRGAFSARPIREAHVALVDDVMTTGATVGECAKALKHAGAESVTVWVAARAV